MKRFTMLLAAGIAASAVFLAGCKTAPSLPTIQQQFAAACPLVNSDLAILAQSPLIAPAAQDLINKQLIPKNKALCAAGAQFNLADAKSIHDSLLPAVVDIVTATPEIPNQPLILLGLTTFGPLVQQLIDQTVFATPASGVTAASAPVAASQ